MAFGVLKNMWGVLKRKTNCQYDHLVEIITACVLLYNFVIVRERDICSMLYSPAEVDLQRERQYREIAECIPDEGWELAGKLVFVE